MSANRTAKTHFNETEAAEFLGVSIGEFRTLIQSHITKEEAELSNVSQAVYQPSDLVLLRFLLGQTRGEQVTFEVTALSDEEVEPPVSEDTESVLELVGAMPGAFKP